MKRSAYRLGRDVSDTEILRDRNGRVVDDTYVSDAVSDALQKVQRRGRPSLSQAGESPLLRVRLSRELDEAVTRAADQRGESRADWVRAVLARAVRDAG